MAALAPTLNFFGVLSESKRIISAHSRHFLALSVLFLLPLSFSLIIYPTLQAILSDSQSRHIQILLGHTQNVQNTPTLDPDSSLKSLALPLTFTLFVFLLSISAAATITYSTYHGFYGRPVKLAAAVKSLFHSFIPLLLTTITSQSLMALVCASFGLFLVLITKSVEILGFEIDYSSNYFLWFCIAISIISASVLAYLHVNWSLACEVVVVESRWGLEALRRSNYLVKGMRTISLSLLLCFGAAIGFSVWVNSATGPVDLGDFRKFCGRWWARAS
ncbi:hypothetical protein U1Q18_016818 [Sarracenia purpurea var. burkii]